MEVMLVVCECACAVAAPDWAEVRNCGSEGPLSTNRLPPLGVEVSVP